MSDPYYDIDERLYDLYMLDCRAKELTPTVRDYIIWKQEEYPELDDDRPEVYDEDHSN